MNFFTNITKHALFIILILILLPGAQSIPASEDIIVRFTTKENMPIQIGTTHTLTIFAKNPANSYVNVPFHVGSPDGTFRYFIQFKNTNYDPHNINITLAPGQEKLILLTVFAGKIGSYELVIGPDNIYENRYDAKRITVINKNAGLFAQSPGMAWPTAILTLILAATIILTRNKTL